MNDNYLLKQNRFRNLFPKKLGYNKQSTIFDTGKTAGTNDIQTELHKTSEEIVKVLKTLMSKLWNKIVWPRNGKKGVYIKFWRTDIRENV